MPHIRSTTGKATGVGAGEVGWGKMLSGIQTLLEAEEELRTKLGASGCIHPGDEGRGVPSCSGPTEMILALEEAAGLVAFVGWECREAFYRLGRSSVGKA